VARPRPLVTKNVRQSLRFGATNIVLNERCVRAGCGGGDDDGGIVLPLWLSKKINAQIAASPLRLSKKLPAQIVIVQKVKLEPCGRSLLTAVIAPAVVTGDFILNSSERASAAIDLCRAKECHGGQSAGRAHGVQLRGRTARDVIQSSVPGEMTGSIRCCCPYTTLWAFCARGRRTRDSLFLVGLHDSTLRSADGARPQ